MGWRRGRMLALSLVSVLVVIGFGWWSMKDSSLSQEVNIVEKEIPLETPFSAQEETVKKQPHQAKKKTMVEPNTEPNSTPTMNMNYIVAIDAGHQKKGNYENESIGPGAKEEKAKVSSGTQGRFTGLTEYQLNLDVSKKLKIELEKRGYQIVMIRETNDVNISNRERAQLASDNDADILVRIHANGSENEKVNGILTISPTKENDYVGNMYQACYMLSEHILTQLIKRTGAQNKGITQTDSMSGINWSTIPVTIVEMGYMTNKEEDELMATEAYQNKITLGIADGIDKYFSDVK